MTTTEWSITNDGSVKTYNINWTMENVDQLRQYATREIYSDIIDSLFQLKIKYIGRERCGTEFYYSSSNPIYFINGQTSCNSRITLRPNKKYYTTEINKWNYLYTSEGDYLSALQENVKEVLNILITVTDIKSNRLNAPIGAALNNDIENILNNEMFSDITIKSIEGNEYKAHKLVLASQSEFLKAYLHNTAECFTDIIETQLEAGVLKEVLSFMYSDAALDVDEISDKLLAAADYYKLDRLKTLCELALHKKLTVDNAIDTLQLAFKYAANELKRSILNFIKDDRASLVTKTEGWKKLDSLQLTKMIHEHYLDDGEQESCSHRKMFTAEFHIETEGCVKIYNINWTIPHIGQEITDNSTQEIHSNVINSMIQLKMKILGKGKIFIEFYYLLCQPVNFTKCKLYISTNNYRWIKDFNVKTKCETPKVNKWYYLGWLSQSNFEYYTRNENMLLNFKISVTDMQVDYRKHYCNTSHMSRNFENTLINEMFSDTIIKSSDDNEFKVHKLILAARSSVLKACFEHNTTECHNNILESPFDSEVLRDVITFMYTDEAPRVNEIPEKLLVAADYYQLSRLKSLCELALQKEIRIDNAIDTLQLAHKYSANSLKESTLKFIKDDKETLITKTDGWAKLDSIECVKIIHTYCVEEDNE